MKKSTVIWANVFILLLGLAAFGFAMFWLFWGALEEVKECFKDEFTQLVSIRYVMWILIGTFLFGVSIGGFILSGKAKNARKLRNLLICSLLLIIASFVNNARYSLEYFTKAEETAFPEIVANALELLGHFGLGFFALGLIALILNIVSIFKVNAFIKKETLKQINNIASRNGGRRLQNVYINTARFGENTQVQSNAQEKVRSQAEITNDRETLKNKIGEEKLAKAKKQAREYKQKLDSGVFTQQEYDVLMAQLKKNLLNN